jgi:hypothetical protein
MAKKTIKEIKSALPGLDSSKVEAYADELDRILAIKRIFQSEDGRVLVNELRDNCSITIKKLLVIYKKNPELPELLGLLAILDSNYLLLSKIQDISLEKEIREQLDEAVKEAYAS